LQWDRWDVPLLCIAVFCPNNAGCVRAKDLSFAVRSLAGVVIFAKKILHGWKPCEFNVAVD